MVKVSVLIPVFNAERYINRLLYSLKKQTLKNFEVILVDDCSTDDSWEMINSFDTEGYFEMKCIRQKKNGGVASARIRAFEESTAEYVTFVDSDDYLDKNYLEELYNTIVATKSNICVARIVYHPSLSPLLAIKNNKRLGFYDLAKNKKILPLMQCGTWGKIYRRKFVLLPDKKLRVNEDLSINHFLFAKARYVSFTNSTFYHYLPNKSGLTIKHSMGINYDNIKNTVIPLEMLKKHFIENDMLSLYYLEVEALFLRFIFQRITEIILSFYNRNKKKKLIELLFSYLSFEFKDWENNPYYLSRFRDFELPERFYYFVTYIYLKTHRLIIRKISANEMLSLYKNY